MSSINIHTLPPVSNVSAEPFNMKAEIEKGLKGTAELNIPGNKEEDKKWAYKRSVPTVVLYDEEGLRLYDRITAEAPEYYPFPDELKLLQTKGEEIALSMGFPEKKRQEQTQEEKEEREREETGRLPLSRWRSAKWGDVDVGKWNGGVNGEEGLASGKYRGWDVVELGAGALRKTAYLLTALSSSLPGGKDTSPITYLPLDLSFPELHRVLGEMDQDFGPQLKDKVDCIGLHGDYEAGLQFIRQGRLSALRESFSAEPGRPVDIKTTDQQDSTITPQVAIEMLTTTDIKDIENSPHFSASSGEAITPGPVLSPPPSAVTDESSDMSRSGTGGDDASGTWSPINSEDPSTDSSPAFHEPPTKHTTSPNEPSRPLHMVFLGSSLGNFERASAAPFLRSIPLRVGDTLLLGLDGRPPPGEAGIRKVELAYNDPAGHTRHFEEHGWDVVRDELGLKGDKGVEFVGRYNELLGRHEAYFKSKDRQTLHLPESQIDITLEKDELLNIEWSYKYSFAEALELFDQADLRVVNVWKAPDSEYRLWLLERPPVRFTIANTRLDSKMIANQEQVGLAVVKGVPKWEEWIALWKLWDHITLDMIPKDMLHQKPIDLRHICLFYLGHIPTFLDIHLTNMTNGVHTEPERFKDIFERGIDPDVDDPTKIHSHSEVPDAEADWPALDEILNFRDSVRQRLRGIYDQIQSGTLELSRHIGRVLFMTFEHEAMHAETLLYMLVQSPLTRPPTAVAIPKWDVLARKWEDEALPNRVLSIHGGKITMGHDDVEGEDQAFPGAHGWEDHQLGWDNEHPAVKTDVMAFKIDALPISNNDYLAFLKDVGEDFSNNEALPASWQKVGDEWKVRSLYGPVGFDVAGRWPLMASKLEIDAYAQSKGGRLPTEGELRMFWESEEGARVVGEEGNVGVKNWHPIPPTVTRKDHAGRTVHGHNGGVWEWTSSDFKGYEGFESSKLYPGYSADFFDGKHFVVLGGSFATVPSIAGRKSFRNWYQANYRFSFIGGRVAYEV